MSQSSVIPGMELVGEAPLPLPPAPHRSRGRLARYASMARRYPGRAAALGAGALGALGGAGLGGAYLLGYGRGAVAAPIVEPQGMFGQATQAVGNTVLNLFTGAKETATNAAAATGQFIAENPYTAGALALGATGATALGARAVYNARQANALKAQQLEEAISLTSDATADLVSQSAVASRSLGSPAASAAFAGVVNGAAATSENLSQAVQALQNHRQTGNPSFLANAERFVDAAIASQQTVERASQRLSQSAVAARQRRRRRRPSSGAAAKRRTSSGKKTKSGLRPRRRTAASMARKRATTSSGGLRRRRRTTRSSGLGRRRRTTRGRNSRNALAA